MMRLWAQIATLCATVLLTGCSFTPRYAEAFGQMASQMVFDYAQPNSRLEQIVYQHLSLSFPTADNSLKLAVSAHSLPFEPLRSDAAIAPTGVTVEITVVIRREDAILASITRRATASYSSTGDQILASNEAQANALEIAAKSAAESIRLAILAMAPNLAV